MKEIFKDIPNSNGLYQVSDLGNVKSLKFNKDRILKKGLCNGYFHVRLYEDGNPKAIKIHQLVAMAFLGHVPDGYKSVINHINFDKLDNKLKNIEIVSHRENTNKKHIKSTSKYTGVSWHKASKKWIAQIIINGKTKYLGVYANELEAANTYDIEFKKIHCTQKKK